MAGYTRQSTADIIPTATVRAAPLNAEYNAIRDAFAASGGHKHDGTTAEGDYVPLISDLDNYNKVVIDSTNNRVGVFVEVSAAAVEQVRFQDGAIVPVTTNDIDLGTSSLKFKDLYLEGTATIGSISLDGGTIDNTVIGGTTPAAATFTTMTATTVDINGGAIDGTTIGATVAAAADFTTMDASGNATVGGTFGVTGNTTIGGTLGVTGVTTLGTANITSVDLDSGAIDNTTIGAATPAAGTFTTLTANTSLTAATADINGGTIDGATIGATSHTTGKFTTLQSTGLATLASVDINGGAIDGTTIGASSAAAGSFTTVSTSGQATLATADINGGTIDGATIGTTTPAAITGTTVTATSFVGPVTGAVTGNVTGNVTGDLTGDVTGNITSSGSSSFNNVTIDGTLNMNAGTTATITNLTSPTNTNDAATKGYVDTSISNLVDSAPGTLDTLNELAAALGDDPNFSTTITTSIATKLPLAGGTMTGAIAMSTNKITGLGDPTAAQDAMTKAYADATYLALSGGTMTGAIDMGSQKITTTYTPTNAADLTTKTYVDGILGSATAASASAAAAATSETNAATSETNAATSASNAATSETNTATLYDNFDDRYLGAKASAPTLDNDGDALITGALYFNTTTNIMNVYGTSGWQSAGSAVNGTSDRQTYTATSGQTVFAATYDTGYVDVYLNGVKLLAGTDFTATNGTSITLASGAAVNDIVDIVAYGTFVLADHYSKSQSDARYVEVAGDTMTGNLDITGDFTVDGSTFVVDSTNNSVGIGNSTPSNNHANANNLVVGDGTAGGIANYVGTGLGWYAFSRDNANNSDAYDGGISYDGSRNLMFHTNAGTERMRIDSSGNVGIGRAATAVGSYKVVDIEGPVGGIINHYVGNTKAGQWYTGTGAAGFGTVTSIPLTFTTGNNERMRIDSSGNVGIGAASPSSTFRTSIYGDGSSIIGGVEFRNAAAGGSTFTIGHSSATSPSATLNVTDAANLIFKTSNTEAMRIDSSGNVGIGTTSPTGKLSVSDPTYLSSAATLGSSITLNSENTASWTGTRELISFESVGNGADHRIGTLSIKLKKGSSDTTLTEYMKINAVSNYITFSTAASEAMRIDSSGALLVGKTAQNSTVTGSQLNSDGLIIATRSSAEPLLLNRKTSDGNIATFQKDGTTVGSIGVVASNNLYVHGDNIGLGIGDDNLYATNASGASNDNAVDLGDPSVRWDDVYATNGTIQTSDRNEKQQIASLTDVEMTAAKAISKLFKTFKWNDSVAEKGDAARTHTGVIAQEVEQAMTDAGLNAGDYAFFISTTWWETQTEVPAVEADEENGVEAQEAYTRTDTYETAEEAPEGATERNRKGIRYPQLLSFIGAATEQRLASIETRLDALEAN